MPHGIIYIPRPLQFIPASDREWWPHWCSSFEDQYHDTSNLLFSERIPSVPRPVREALADCFCPEEFRTATKASAKNQICLIHPLLGRRKGKHTIRGMLNLRNFELCIDQIEYLGLGINSLIDSLAQELAILHFKARVDAHDVEFVFGAAPTLMHNSPVPFAELDKMPQDSSVKFSGTGMNLHRRGVHLWMLDFNRVSRIPDTTIFLPMALEGFVDQSKAYYPRPRFPPNDTNSGDNKNWETFKSAYLKASGVLQTEEYCDLPEQFLSAVEHHHEAQSLRQMD